MNHDFVKHRNADQKQICLSLQCTILDVFEFPDVNFVFNALRKSMLLTDKFLVTVHMGKRC